ncbi:MAG: hypothetical protein U0Q16_30045 [Bryobacteraceae bacterium]
MAEVEPSVPAGGKPLENTSDQRSICPRPAHGRIGPFEIMGGVFARRVKAAAAESLRVKWR